MADEKWHRPTGSTDMHGIVALVRPSIGTAGSGSGSDSDWDSDSGLDSDSGSGPDSD